MPCGRYSSMTAPLADSIKPMRQIYMPRDGIRFRPEPAHIAQFLPEVARLHLTFLQPTPQDLALCSDLASQLVLDFLNGTQLTLSGAFLWKFCEAIPPELGSDEVGWNDDNPYGPGDTEWLMRRIRVAYQEMFEQEEIDYTVRPPLRASIDFMSMATTVEFPAELSVQSRAELADWMLHHLVRCSEPFQGWLTALVQTALASPRHVLEHYPVGNGYIGQRFVEKPWPANPLHALTLEDFLSETGPEEATPWRRNYREIVAERLTLEVRRGFLETLRMLKRGDPELLATIAKELRFGIPSSGRLLSKPIEKALAESREEERLFFAARRYLLPDESAPLGAYLQQR